MYHLSFTIDNASHLLLVLYVVLCSISSFVLFFYCKNLPNWISQKNTIVEQSINIESLNRTIDSLYNGLFELETLLEDIIYEIDDEQQITHSLEHKKRIVNEIKN